MESISLFVAFGAGFLSFLSPCVVPLVPVYLASLAGPQIFESNHGIGRFTLLLHSLLFVLGFSVVFSLWGAGAGVIGSAMVGYLPLVRKIVGGLLVAVGVLMIASLKVPWLNYERGLRLHSGKASYWRSFLIGAVFTLAWTPCLGATVSGILSLAASSGTMAKGTVLLAVYSLGLGIPFLLMGGLFDRLLPLLKRMHKYSVLVYVVGGLLFVAVGVLTLTDNLTWFQVAAW